MILDITELSQYAPSLVDNPSASGIIALSQSLIESSQGANRPLEIREYQEIKKINRLHQNVFCSYTPIVATETLTIEVRFATQTTRFGRMVNLSDWIEIPPSNYILDSGGRISFNKVFNLNLGNIPDEAKLTYQSGFDFSDNSNPEVLTLKTMFGQVLEYTQSNSFKGIKKIDISGEVSVEYNSSSNLDASDSAYKVPNNLLLAFKKYQPRGVFGGTR
jgi:hypothetical protein